VATGTLGITGGDITVNGTLSLGAGIIDTGTNKLIHMSGVASRSTGYVEGTLVRGFTSPAQQYTYLVGDGHYSPVKITATTLPSGPTDVAVMARDVTLAGLNPATAASVSWDIAQSGTMTSRLDLTYDNSDINGNESIYRAWRSTSGSPSLVASSVSASANTVTVQGIADLTAGWGIKEGFGTVTISGTVMSAGGAGIRGAFVEIVGGGITTPILLQTGSFGNYVFNVEAGFEYTVSASAKRNRFATPSYTFMAMTSVSDLNFVANPQE
jgi:hypothetical protein